MFAGVPSPFGGSPLRWRDKVLGDAPSLALGCRAGCVPPRPLPSAAAPEPRPGGGTTGMSGRTRSGGRTRGGAGTRPLGRRKQSDGRGVGSQPALVPSPDTRAVSDRAARGWGGSPPDPGSSTDRETETKVSPRAPRAPARPAVPPPFRVQSPPAALGGAGGWGRGGGPGARVSAPTAAAGVPAALAAQALRRRQGRGGPGQPLPAARGAASAPEAGGRRRGRGLDVGDRAARNGKRLIKPRRGRPTDSAPRSPGSAARAPHRPRTDPGSGRTPASESPARPGRPPPADRRGPGRPRRRGHARPTAWPRPCLRALRS